MNDKYKNKIYMNKVIRFHAQWCQPCRAMKPQFDKFHESIKENDIEILEIDVDKDYQIADDYSVRSIPTTLFIKNSEVEESLRGAVSAETLLRKYNQIYEIK